MYIDIHTYKDMPTYLSFIYQSIYLIPDLPRYLATSIYLPIYLPTWLPRTTRSHLVLAS